MNGVSPHLLPTNAVKLPISEINFPTRAQLIPISVHSFLSYKMGMEASGMIVEFFCCEPCCAKGAFLSPAFTNHILMARSWQQWPASSPALE